MVEPLVGKRRRGKVKEPKPGDYWPASVDHWKGYWQIVLPNGFHGMLKPTVHEVIEHADGTITVNPSILLTETRDKTGKLLHSGWHGWLRKGVWTEC